MMTTCWPGKSGATGLGVRGGAFISRSPKMHQSIGRPSHQDAPTLGGRPCLVVVDANDCSRPMVLPAALPEVKFGSTGCMRRTACRPQTTVRCRDDEGHESETMRPHNASPGD